MRLRAILGALAPFLALPAAAGLGLLLGLALRLLGGLP